MHGFFMQGPGRFWREYAGNGGVVQFDGKSPLDVGHRKLRALKELIADWSDALALVIVPGALVGALLKRLNRRLPAALVICITAEGLRLTPAAFDLVILGWEPILDLIKHGWRSEVAEGLLLLLRLLHVILLLPILLALSTGYVGWGYIQTRKMHRTN
jgi:hypothetical protein